MGLHVSASGGWFLRGCLVCLIVAGLLALTSDCTQARPIQRLDATAATSGWVSLGSPGQSDGFYSIAFADAAHGWVVGPAGTVFATADGGASWKRRRPNTSADLWGVACTDDDHAWVVGAGSGSRGVIHATTDGGVTWRRQALVDMGFFSDVAFCDSLHGWAVGYVPTINLVRDSWGWNTLILATTDGGVTWVRQVSPIAHTVLTAVTCTDARHAWAVGYSGAVIATKDRGATWTRQSSGTKEALDDVSFADPEHGWAVGIESPLLTTTDGGGIWTKRSLGKTNGMVCVDFSDADHGWAIREDIYTEDAPTQVLFTSDGGVTWTAQAMQDGIDVGGPLDFIDASQGWVIGWDSSSAGGGADVILRTVDGGGPAPSGPPSITGFAPTSAAQGAVVTLTGANLGDATSVSFSGIGARFTVVSPTTLRAVVSKRAQSGYIAVCTPVGVTTSAEVFTALKPPSLEEVHPSFARRGALVSIKGTGFGASQGASVVRFGAEKCATCVCWSDLKITCRVPPTAPKGHVRLTVQTGYGTSDSLRFTIRK